MKKFHSLLILLLWSSGFLLAQQSPDCEENVDAVDTTTVVSNTLQASNTLTVNRKLNSGDTLRLIGGQLIELLPGFEADLGSFIEGTNGECIDLSAAPFMMNGCEFISGENSGQKDGKGAVNFSNGLGPFIVKITSSDGVSQSVNVPSNPSSNNYEVVVEELAAGEYEIIVVDQATGQQVDCELNIPEKIVLGEDECATLTAPESGENCILWTTEGNELDGVDVNEKQIEVCPDGITVYGVSVSDGLNEVDDKLYEVIPCNLDISISEEAIVLCGMGDTETVSVSVNEDAGAVTYLWSNGEAGASIDISEAGTYSVTVTAEDGRVCSEEVVVADGNDPESVRMLLEQKGFECAPFTVIEKPPGIKDGADLNKLNEDIDNHSDWIVSIFENNPFDLESWISEWLSILTPDNSNSSAIIAANNFCDSEATISLDEFLSFAQQHEYFLQALIIDFPDTEEDCIMMRSHLSDTSESDETEDELVECGSRECHSNQLDGPCETYEIKPSESLLTYEYNVGDINDPDNFQEVGQEASHEFNNLDNCMATESDMTDCEWGDGDVSIMNPECHSTTLQRLHEDEDLYAPEATTGFLRASWDLALWAGTSGWTNSSPRSLFSYQTIRKALRNNFISGQGAPMHSDCKSPFSKSLKALDRTKERLSLIEELIKEQMLQNGNISPLFQDVDSDGNHILNNILNGWNYNTCYFSSPVTELACGSNMFAHTVIGGVQYYKLTILSLRRIRTVSPGFCQYDCDSKRIQVRLLLTIGDRFGAGGINSDACTIVPGVPAMFLLQHFRNDDCPDGVDTPCYIPFEHTIDIYHEFTFTLP